jgi:hypothetical protein
MRFLKVPNPRKESMTKFFYTLSILFIFSLLAHPQGAVTDTLAPEVTITPDKLSVAACQFFCNFEWNEVFDLSPEVLWKESEDVSPMRYCGKCSRKIYAKLVENEGAKGAS